MAVPTLMTDLSTTESANSPAGSESPISTDNFHRAIQSILRHTNAKGADIASATTTNIGAATGEFVDVTGTTTITGLGTIDAGIVRTVRFTGALTLTHNATSLILPNSSNITTFNGYIAVFRSLGSGNWVLVTDNLNPAVAIQLQTYTAFTTGGTSSAFTVTATPALTTYTNSRLAVTLNAAPTGSPTINYNSLGAKNFKYKDNTGTKQFVTSTQAPSGHLCDLWYDGTDVLLQNPLPASIASNRIINGAFDVAQRGTTYALTNAVVYGSVDRWNVWQGGASAAGIANQVASGLDTFRYALKLGRNSGSALTNTFNVLTALETANSISLQGKTVTLSFYAKAGANFSATSNNINVTLYTGTGTDQSAATVSSWTGTATPISTTQAITTSWVRYSFTATLGATVSQIGVLIVYTSTGTAGADDNLYITGVQLEEGASASAFERRSYGTELALCQRYYYRTPIVSAGSLGTVNVTSATTSVTNTPFHTQMRITPTSLEQSGTAGDYTVYSGGVGRACSAVVTYSASTTAREGVCVATVASGQTTGHSGFIYSTATAGYFGWSAEL